ncbi:MAG: glycolate oxidase subunit GlcF [Rhodospirillales bacterium]
MQTTFTEEQLADPRNRSSEAILRRCVHCGFCTATCPTYVLLGDELDSPRGRIYLIKDMLENDRQPTADTVKHIDRCLSCLSCRTTCPSGVDYMHLIDHGREVVEERYRRPLLDRLYRSMIAVLVPRPGLFRLAMVAGWFARPFRRLVPGRLGAMLALVPSRIDPASSVDRPQVFPAEGPRRRRVALMTGCAQQALRPAINEATVRLLTRLGCEVVIADGMGCCGALEHHMGRTGPSHQAAKKNIEAWERAGRDGGELDAIVVNASGCGTTVKDYGYMLANDPEWAERAERISALAQDITEVLVGAELPVADADGLKPVVAYHSACSMQHGQGISGPPVELLRRAGFEVRQPAEGHLCCGSAGSYNMTQPGIAARLGKRKAANLAATGADVVASGNIGCQMQIGLHGDLAVCHTVELLDWATGGPKPDGVA